MDHAKKKKEKTMKTKKAFQMIMGFILVVLILHPAQGEIKAIKAGKLVDVEKGTTLTDQIILIEGKMIKAIGGDIEIPDGAKVIDLSDKTVLPGLYDCHVHLFICIPAREWQRSVDEKYRSLFWRYGNGYLNYTINTTTTYRALQGVKNAQEMLEAGFTTIRDSGGVGNYADTDLRRAVEHGLVPGPTIINSGRIISPIGGQFTYGLQPERPGQGEPEYFYADTKDEIVKAVRENILYGAKVIKIIADDQPYIYSVEDIELIKKEAERAGLRVAAHSLIDEGAHNCAKAGIASIEHGFRMSNKTLELAKKNNVYLVGTDFTEEYWKEGYGYSDKRAKEMSEMEIDRIKRAYKIGVPMAFGSDVIWEIPGKTWGEVCKSIMDSYVRAELPEHYILKMMTVFAARLLGVENKSGSLKEGMEADIIATPENPLDNIQTLKNVIFVMKNGKVYKSL
jgi:imidazolonepropionase-like amidohydrolase